MHFHRTAFKFKGRINVKESKNSSKFPYLSQYFNHNNRMASFFGFDPQVYIHND